MGKEQATVDEMIWAAISPEARQDWAVAQAARDPKILATIRLLTAQDFDGVTVDLIKDHLETAVVAAYGVPPERSEEVFSKAEALIWQDREAWLEENNGR